MEALKLQREEGENSALKRAFWKLGVPSPENNHVALRRVFLSGLLLKFAFLFFSGSSYLTELFIPFLDFAVTHPLENPWSHLPAENFPYGSVLYGLLFLPRFLAQLVLGDAALGSGPFGLFLVKGVLLAADTWLLSILYQRVPVNRRMHLFLFYWFNPVLFYISYVHGQLDVVSIAFCVASLHSLSRRQTFASSLLFAAAVLSKFHAVILAPFVLSYLWRSDYTRAAIRKAAAWMAVSLPLIAVGFLPQMTEEKLGEITVTSKKALSILGMSAQFADGRSIFFGLIGLTVLIARLCNGRKITERGLIFGSGMIFGVLILITASMPGWYFWVVPFLALFYASYPLENRKVFYIFSALHVFYFAFLWQIPENFSAYLPLLQNLTFSVTQAFLAIMLLALWQSVMTREVPGGNAVKPVTIGIAGDSAVGKSTLSWHLSQLFPVGGTLILQGDNYHRWSRGDHRWEKFTHLDPRANSLHRQTQDVYELLAGRSVVLRPYDHRTGSFQEGREVVPERALIVEGLHAFVQPALRSIFDLKIFISVDESQRLKWKFERDQKERGKSVRDIAKSESKRRNDRNSYIAGQASYADWLIEIDPQGVRHTILNSPRTSAFTDYLLLRKDLGVSVTVPTDAVDRLTLEIKGEGNFRLDDAAIRNLIPDIHLLTFGFEPTALESGHWGFCQVMALVLMQERMAA